MSEVERYADEMKELYKHAQDFKDKIGKACGGSFEWAMDEVIGSYHSMFDRFCPYKIGDVVYLKEDVKKNEKFSGWDNSLHFMKKGAKCIVRERGYSKDNFTFHIEFENETWISNDDGLERPVNQKYLYHFSEKMLTSDPDLV